jgi:hypothetical protein
VRRIVVSCILMAVMMCLLSTISSAAVSEREFANNQVAEEMISASGITWVPRVNFYQLLLTVSRPDGTVFSKTFESGGSPYIDLSTLSSDTIADGSYTYELRVIPFQSKKVRRDDEQESIKGDKGILTQPFVQNGHFIVQGGAIVTSAASENQRSSDSSQDGLSRTQDLCYADDMIIQYSLCVGVDCVCNMNFGFDTIVLKENNLRILFDDTSTSGSFPYNDWRLIANDSNNGGASYFAIEDATAGRRPFTVEAGAPANTLYVKNSGRVGIGTATPSTKLHVVYCDTPAMRLDQDGSCGWAAQIWDVAGNETNFFIRDVSHSSNLPFRIRATAPHNSLYINTNGYIGFGTQTPSFPVHLLTNSSSNALIAAQRTGGVTTYMNATADTGVFGTANDAPLRMVVNSQWQMEINSSTDISMLDGGGYNGTWNPASSRELKENITDLAADEAMDALEGLNPVKYNYKKDKEDPRVGFIAEDVPELVAMKERKSLGTVDIIAVLTKVVKEQQKSLNDQQEIISQLQQRISELEKNLK